MDRPTLLSLVAFSLVMSITPGPNNLLLSTSALAYGFRKTLPAMAGTLLGVGLVFLAAGAGIGVLLLSIPGLHTGLKVVGAGYLLYLAWQLWVVRPGKQGDGRASVGFWHGAIFQFANPKAWMMTISAVGIYVAPASDYVGRLLMVTSIFLVVTTPSITLWTGFGAGMRALIHDPGQALIFNRGMALLTAVSAILILVWT